MALISLLKQAIDKLPDSISVDSIRNTLKKSGVKDTEIDASEVLDDSWHSWDAEGNSLLPENGRLTRAQLQKRLEQRGDVTSVIEDKSFVQISVPATNKSTYRTRVYTNPQLAAKGIDTMNHWRTPNYIMHTRSDVIDASAWDLVRRTEREGRPRPTMTRANGEVVTLGHDYEASVKLANSVEPTFGEKAIRIQEIQSDTANKLIDGSLSQTTITRSQLEDELTNLNYDPSDPLDAQIDYLKTVYGLTENDAGRVLDELDKAEPRINVANDISHLSDEQAIKDPNKIIEEFEIWVAKRTDKEVVSYADMDNLDSAKFHDFLNQSYNMSFAQAQIAEDAILTASRDQDFGDAAVGTKIDVRKIVEHLPEFKVPYVRQALFQELDRAQQEGIREVQIAIAPEDAKSLRRAPGVQKNYETTVKNTAEKIAKQIGAEVQFKKGYLILGLPAAGFTLPLYAQQQVPMAEDKDQSFIKTATDLGHSEQDAKDTLFRRKAKQAGYGDQEIEGLLAQKRGQSPISTAAPGEQAMAVPPQVTEEPPIMSVPVVNPGVRGSNESRDQFAARLNEENPNLTPVTGKDDLVYPAPTVAEVKERTARQYVSELQQSLSVARPYLELTSFASDESRARLDVYNQELGNAVSELAAAKQINLTYEDGTYYVTDSQGNRIEATPTVMQDIWGTKGEMAGAIAGATTGFKYTPGNALFKLAGAVVGGALGSVVGTELDYVNAALATRQELDGRLAFEKAVGAAEASITYDVLFGSGLWAGKKAIQLGSTGWKALKHSYELVKNGNREGAFRTLKESLDMNDDQVQQTIDLWEKVNGMKVPGNNMQEQALAVLPTTAPGGQDILEAVSRENPAASSAIQRDVNQRAQTLLEESYNIADDAAAERVLTNLRAVVDDTKLLMDTTKQEFNGTVDLALTESPAYEEPLQNMFNAILNNMNVDVASRGGYEFMNDLKMPQMMAKANNLIEPNDLLEFRNSLTAMKYSSSIRSTPVLQQIDSVINMVDGHITEAAKTSFGEEAGEEWLEQWETARTEYSKMLTIQRNGLFTALTKETTAGKAITPKTIANALIKYGPSIDDAYIRRGGEPVNTYNEIIDELPTNTVRDVEGMIIQGMVEKWTSGQQGGLRATQFPALADALSVYDFRSADAQRVKTVVEELGSLYKNDVPIAQATGAISFQPFQSYLTTNPVVRAKFAIASGIFNYVSTLKGGAQADTRAMVNWVGKMLAEPLNPRTTAHVIDEVKQDQAVVKAIEDYQKEVAAAKARGEPDQFLRVRTYKDRQGNIFSKPGKGLTASDSIAGKSIARDEYVISKYGVPTIDSLTRLQKAELIGEGFEAVMLSSGQIIKLF